MCFPSGNKKQRSSNSTLTESSLEGVTFSALGSRETFIAYAPDELQVLNQPIAFCRLEASPSCIASSPNYQKSISIAKTRCELITNLIGGLFCLNNPGRVELQRAIPELGYAPGQKCACGSGPTSVVAFHMADNIGWHLSGSNRRVLKRPGESADPILLVNLAKDIREACAQGGMTVVKRHLRQRLVRTAPILYTR